MTKLNTQASLMCVVSKVDELTAQSTDVVVQWLDALNPLIIKLKRCIEVMCSRAIIGLTFFALQVKAKFHYTSWFEAGRRPVQNQIPLCYLVQSWSQTGSKRLRPASNLSATSFKPDNVMEFGRGPASSCQFTASKLDHRLNFSSLQVCDQL